jgi:hypothetical protein
MPDEVMTQARVAAARQGVSLSKYVSYLVARELGGVARTQLEVIEEFFSGPGYPGISKDWHGREELYAERENDLLRRHEHTRVRDRPRRAREAAHRGGFAEKNDRRSYARPKSPKPK